MNFNDYRNSLVEDSQEIENLNEAAFNTKNLKRVSDLLAKIASKKLGADFQFAWADNFKKSDGAIGVGLRYMSLQGQQIRFNNLAKSKNTFSINSVDYWKPGAKITEPSLTLYFKEGVNIVQIKEQLFDSIKAGKVLPIKVRDLMESSISEASKEEKAALRQSFTQKHNIPDSYARNLSTLKHKAVQLGIDSELDAWMTMSSNVSEKTEFDTHIREDEKKLGPSGVWADPKYVFQDMEEAAKVIAKGLWRSMVIVGAPGIGKCVSGSTKVNIKGL